MSFDLALPNQRQPQQPASSTQLEVVMPPVKQWLESRRASVQPSVEPTPTTQVPSGP